MDIPTKLIVGLGNPGKEGEYTRHDIGFDVVDAFAHLHGIAINKLAFSSRCVVQMRMTGGWTPYDLGDRPD